MKFSHLHVHTQFSLLDGAASIPDLYKKAASDEMPALAITDHGNMFGVFKFVAEAYKNTVKDPSGKDVPKVKPIVGCEFYLVEDRHRQQFSKEVRDKRFHQLFLAKNEEGYRNLVKLCSLGFIEGMYSKYPRIDKELVLKYHKGLIATTCCIGASVPRVILQQGEAAGEEEFKWWLDIFGEDYYVELQRHDIPEQNVVNEVLLKFAAKYNVKVIASNDSHYVDREDANAHDILLCINTGEKQSTPTMKEFADDEVSVRGTRFAFYNDQFYFKTTQEMSKLFADVPQAIDNTNEIVSKVDLLNLNRDILLPNFPIPQEFQLHSTSEFHNSKELKPEVLNQWEFLRHLTMEGAKKRYGEISPDIQERLDFELFTIKTMGFAGYFLIVADFIRAGRDLGVFVGPGRGSAAGSAVAYCIGITNIDPIKYDLLFERFLNPERYSMPDIDTDFDDDGRQKVIDYVVDKYGKQQVASIVTYGTMAAKISIKDVARVLDLPLSDSDMLTKLVPDKPGIQLDRVLNAPLEGEKSLKEKEGLVSEDLENVKKLRGFYHGNDIHGKVLKEALVLEGSVRGTGVHAAGIIIAPKDLTELLPVATVKDSDLLLTQFDGSVIENAGVIKMDFLGLKTLSIIRDALTMIKQNHQIEIEIDNIPLDDEPTYQLYQRGETTGTFQFESPGMQKYLIQLKPDQFEDLIAMNALYRPGPLEYIPNFIKRKKGEEPVTYDLPELEEYLKETYGITVYQEQVMLLSQKLAGFSKGKADVLRKAMGKKDRKTLDKLKPEFLEGAMSKGLAQKPLEKIWTDWEAFASYAFNKSHSTCYAFVAYQTAYLKAHYPSEYMASVLIHNQNNIESLTFYMEECRRMNIDILSPDVNESGVKFTVNKRGQIRFGLAAIKGVGEGAVDTIIQTRNEGGDFKSVFDFAKRVNLKNVNKKVFENLAQAGAFDCFGYSRSSYFESMDNGRTNALEMAVKFGNSYKAMEGSIQNSLFGGGNGEVDLPEPNLIMAEEWPLFEKLNREKELVGIYLSGHPLDQFKFEMERFKMTRLSDLDSQPEGRDTIACGIVTDSRSMVSKKGSPYGSFTIEDYSGSKRFTLFSKDYLQAQVYLTIGNMVAIRGKVQKRFNGDQLEFSVRSVELLGDLRDKVFNEITITLDLNMLSGATVSELLQLITAHPGTKTLKVRVVDPIDRMDVEMLCRSYRVDLTNEFLDGLKHLVARTPEFK